MSRKIALLVLLLGVFAADRAFANDSPSLDVRKSIIESPVKSILFTPHMKPKLKEIASLDKNQRRDKVKPGLVNWHDSMEEAKKAAERSQKPILVFHMMGNLDDRFC